MPEQHAEVGSFVIRRDEKASVHVRVAAGLVAQQSAHPVDLFAAAGVLTPGSHGLPGDVRQPVRHDPERLARRVVIDGADLQAREYRTRHPPGAVALSGPRAVAPGRGPRENRTVPDLLDPSVCVEIAVGVEGFDSGEITLAVGGDGSVQIVQRVAGEVHERDGSLDREMLEDYFGLLECNDLERLEPLGQTSPPGDVPVRVRIRRGDEIVHEAMLWHSERYRDDRLDAILRRWESLVSDLSRGQLP